MTRIAVLVTHPIPHFAPWHRETARLGIVEQKVFFCCDWGISEVRDKDFGTSFRWDVPLTEGYDHEFLPIARRPERLDFRSVDNPDVSDALDRFDPDIVQVFGYAQRTMWRAVRWAARRGRPVLIFSDSNVQAPTALWKKPLKAAVLAAFYRHVDGALYIGDNNRAFHARQGIPEERLFPGVCPIDRRRLLDAVEDPAASRRTLRQRYGIPEDAFLLVACGKYIPRKRLQDVVEACARLAEHDPPVWALLVGEGPQRTEIEARIALHDLKRVILTGFVNQGDIPAHFAAADLLVVPSGRDPHPLVVSEGASFGLPVVASDAIGCIGPNDTTRDGVNARVYPCGDVDGLGRAVAEIAADPVRAKAMSEASRRISEWQDASVAAVALAQAAEELVRMGPRRPA